MSLNDQWRIQATGYLFSASGWSRLFDYVA